MYTASVTTDATARSLRELLNAALDSDADLPAINQFTGRCFQVILMGPNTASVASFGGTPETNNGVPLPGVAVPLVFSSPTGNQISIDEIFLFGTGPVGVIIVVL
jgi:hypothetical protein